MRRILYHIAHVLGDLHAIEHGRVPQRLVRRVIYRHAFHAAGWLSRAIGVGR